MRYCAFFLIDEQVSFSPIFSSTESSYFYLTINDTKLING